MELPLLRSLEKEKVEQVEKEAKRIAAMNRGMNKENNVVVNKGSKNK